VAYWDKASISPVELALTIQVQQEEEEKGGEEEAANLNSRELP